MSNETTGWIIVLSILLPIVVGIFWLVQFVQLMRLEDREFPGRHDKVLWVAAFLLAFPLAPIAFLIFRSPRALVSIFPDREDYGRDTGVF